MGDVSWTHVLSLNLPNMTKYDLLPGLFPGGDSVPNMTRGIALQPDHLLRPHRVPWENPKPVLRKMSISNLFVLKPHVVAGVEESERFSGQETRRVSPQWGVNDDGPTFGQEHIVVKRCRWWRYWHMEVPVRSFEEGKRLLVTVICTYLQCHCHEGRQKQEVAKTLCHGWLDIVIFYLLLYVVASTQCLYVQSTWCCILCSLTGTMFVCNIPHLCH